MTTKEIIAKVWEQGELVLPKNETKGLTEDLLVEGMVIVDQGRESKIVKLSEPPKNENKNDGHEYLAPHFSNEVEALCKKAIEGQSFNILLVGPAGSGKSEFIREVALKYGFGRVFQVNGRDDIDSSDFLGDKTVLVDKETKQNFISFEKGPLYQAFIEGTEVDEKGNQILYDDSGCIVNNGSGKPKVVGKPAIFFLDEFAALQSGVFLSVFNRPMEIPKKKGESRSMEISGDGGRVVKSHPGFALFLAGNTAGKGTESESQMGFTAQNNQMDDSTLSRITGVYKFGYNLQAEEKIILNKLNDDFEAERLLKFRDAIRKQWKEGNVETLLSTRSIVQICELARTFREFSSDYVTNAIYRSLFCMLREREIHAWNETVRMIFGTDLLQKESSTKGEYFFAEKV